MLWAFVFNMLLCSHVRRSSFDSPLPNYLTIHFPPPSSPCVLPPCLCLLTSHPLPHPPHQKNVRKLYKPLPPPFPPSLPRPP